MAEHVDTAGQLDEPVPAQVARRARAPLAIGLLLLALVSGVVGWLGYRGQQAHDIQAERDLYLQVARQSAVNLTTISYTDTDGFLQRIRESATGTFRDEFQKRSQPFVDVVKQAQSKSAGTVTEAALQSATDEQAQVLVAVSVITSIGAAPQGDPRHWRMRISVQKTGDDAKVSNVVFVP